MIGYVVGYDDDRNFILGDKGGKMLALSITKAKRILKEMEPLNAVIYKLVPTKFQKKKVKKKWNRLIF